MIGRHGYSIFLYFVPLNRKEQWFTSIIVSRGDSSTNYASMEEIHVTFVHESAEISSFLMFMNSRLLMVFI